MEQTQYYSFNKPELSDPANITQLNSNWDDIDTELECINYNLEQHQVDKNNPHNVTKEQLGIDLTDFEEHIADKSNPHEVTKEQLGIDLTPFEEHIENTDNPHNVTATQVNAVSKDGDTVNGNLTVKGAFTVEDNPIKATNGVTTTEIQGGVNGSNENGHHYLDINLFGQGGTARMRINLEENGKLLSAKELFYLTTIDHNTKDSSGNDVQKWYRVFHEGSKPSGSYNGTNTAKTINTGGIGNALLVWRNYGEFKAIITPSGGFAFGDNTGIDAAWSRNEVMFENGTLVISTSMNETLTPNKVGAINQSGITYKYQVL